MGVIRLRFDTIRPMSFSALQATSRLRKKAFRSLLSLSVVSPRGGELNTSGAERAERANESARCESKRKEDSFIAGCGKIFHKEIGFSAPC